MTRLVLALVFVVFGTSGCGCGQLRLAAKCHQGNGNQATCQAMAEDCYTQGGPTCEGVECGPCEPEPTQRRCVFARTGPSQCPRDARIFSNGQLGDLGLYEWKAKKLSPATRALSGRRLSAADVDTMAVTDRAELCSGYPNDSCTLKWNAATAVAECTLPPTLCDSCRYRDVPVTCTAKNKCNGVICF